MYDGLDPTTIIFALLAIFVVWKLRSVLGARVDIEKRPPSRPGPAPVGPASESNVVRLPGAVDRHPAGAPPAADGRFDAYAKSDKARAGLAAIAGVDQGFDVGRFLDGAKIAYEMIIGAFAEGDRTTLGRLLSPEVLGSFVSVIEQRDTAGEKASAKLVSIDSLEIVDAALKESNAQISLRISAKMINCVRDRSEAIVSGDPETIVSTDDLWTFARVVAARDPTWRLIATESEHHG